MTRSESRLARGGLRAAPNLHRGPRPPLGALSPRTLRASRPPIGAPPPSISGLEALVSGPLPPLAHASRPPFGAPSPLISGLEAPHRLLDHFFSRAHATSCAQHSIACENSGEHTVRGGGTIAAR